MPRKKILKLQNSRTKNTIVLHSITFCQKAHTVDNWCKSVPGTRNLNRRDGKESKTKSNSAMIFMHISGNVEMEPQIQNPKPGTVNPKPQNRNPVPGSYTSTRVKWKIKSYFLYLLKAVVSLNTKKLKKRIWFQHTLLYCRVFGSGYPVSILRFLLSDSGPPFPVFRFWVSVSGCQFRFSYSGFPIPVFQFWFFDSGYPVPVVGSRFYSSSSSVLVPRFRFYRLPPFLYLRLRRHTEIGFTLCFTY